MHISGPEKALFYLLTAISLAIMAYQIAQRARLWMTGRPTESRGEATTPNQWVRSFWTYVIEQKKVRTSRKRSGAPMHLMIFYGFVTLFIGTTLLAINTYSPWKFHKGTYYLVYEVTLDVMGVVFILGVIWAFFRRIRMGAYYAPVVELARESQDPALGKQAAQARRAPLSQGVGDYLTLALLLILGVTGFLLEAARISNITRPWDWASPVGFLLSQTMPYVSDGDYKIIWWFHAFWVFVFFATLPQMRIRHIVLGILSVSGAPKRSIGKLRTIPMEEVEQTEQVGVKLAKDYSRWNLLSLDACMECGRCTEACPAWGVGKALNPKQVVQDIRASMGSGEAVALAISHEALWQCTTCSACVDTCPVQIRHVDMIVDARRNVVSEGELSGSAATMLRQTSSTGNAWGAPASSREDWMKGLDIPLCRDGVEFDYLFWVGCAGATDPGAIGTTKAVAQLLKKAGVKFACLGSEEACTGDPARRIGEEFLFQEQAAKNSSVFEKYSVRKVVTACPHCFNTLKQEYGDFGASLEVLHHSQLLANLVAKGDLLAAKPGRGEVAFHDPCYLARINGESDAPRAVLGQSTRLNSDPDPMGASGSDLAEPLHRGRKTLCCGAGGGRMWMEEPPSQRPADRRVGELLATGAKTVAVACPFCRIMLDASVKAAAEDVKLVDIAEMLRDANA